MMRVLAVEDGDQKWQRVEPLLLEALGPESEIIRVRDQFEAERSVAQAGWDLLILDISLDIRAGGPHGGRGSHDYTAGLKIAGRMFYLECEIPTIILTGFDAFPSGRATSDKDVILGLEDVAREASRFLGDHLLGTIRVGVDGWEKALTNLVLRQLKA